TAVHALPVLPAPAFPEPGTVRPALQIELRVLPGSWKASIFVPAFSRRSAAQPVSGAHQGRSEAARQLSLDLRPSVAGGRLGGPVGAFLFAGHAGRIGLQRRPFAAIVRRLSFPRS